MRACVAGRPAVPRKPPYPSPRSGVRSTNKPPPTFKWKEYRLDGAERYNRVMTLLAHEFIRRFLMHVLPAGFHRIRYYGLLTCQTRDRNIARIREPLALPLIPVDAIKAASPQPEEPKAKSTRASLPMLRQQYAHHRDLLARATARCFEKPSAPPHAAVTKDQDRHLMMPAPPTPTCTPIPRAKPLPASPSFQPPQSRQRAKIPIAPAASSARGSHCPISAISCLGAFPTPAVRALDGLAMPASENLRRSRRMHASSEHEAFAVILDPASKHRCVARSRVGDVILAVAFH
jgi:hypothetical protein